MKIKATSKMAHGIQKKRPKFSQRDRPFAPNGQNKEIARVRLSELFNDSRLDIADLTHSVYTVRYATTRSHLRRR